MKLATVLGVVALTTTATLLHGFWRRRLTRAALSQAIGTALEYVGLAAGFLVLNVGVGVMAVLLLRSTTRYFVSIYVIDDVLVVVLSMLQALVLRPLLLPVREPHPGE